MDLSYAAICHSSCLALKSSAAIPDDVEDSPSGRVGFFSGAACFEVILENGLFSVLDVVMFPSYHTEDKEVVWILHFIFCGALFLGELFGLGHVVGGD